MKNSWLSEFPVYFTPPDGSQRCLSKDAPSPPPAPDYVGAARETQKSQMSSQYTPYGNQVYTADSNSPSGYRSDITLTPQARGTLDSQLNLSGNLGQLAEHQLGRVNSQYGVPMDMSSVGEVADNAYRYETDRLDPQWQMREKQFDQKMADQGIVAGGEAYDNASRDFGEQRNDAYTQARKQALGTMPQTYQLARSIYDQPLNTLNAVRTGAQIQNPQFSGQPGNDGRFVRIAWNWRAHVHDGRLANGRHP